MGLRLCETAVMRYLVIRAYVTFSTTTLSLSWGFQHRDTEYEGSSLLTNDDCDKQAVLCLQGIECCFQLSLNVHVCSVRSVCVCVCVC